MSESVSEYTGNQAASVAVPNTDRESFYMSEETFKRAMIPYMKAKYRQPHKIVSMTSEGTGYRVTAEPDPNAPKSGRRNKKETTPAETSGRASSRK